MPQVKRTGCDEQRYEIPWSCRYLRCEGAPEDREEKKDFSGKSRFRSGIMFPDHAEFKCHDRDECFSICCTTCEGLRLRLARLGSDSPARVAMPLLSAIARNVLPRPK